MKKAKVTPHAKAILYCFTYSMGYKRIMLLTGISKRRLKKMKGRDCRVTV